MKKCTLVENAIPNHIRVTKERAQELNETADALIAETLHAYEGFVANGRQLPSDRWKHVKSRENMRVYRSRHSGKKQELYDQAPDDKAPRRPKLLSPRAMEEHRRQAAADGKPDAFDDPLHDDDDDDDARYPIDSFSSGTDPPSFSLWEESTLAKVKPSHVPLIVAIGQIEGSLADVAFGCLAHTRDTWLVRDSYLPNSVVDARKILGTLQTPSDADPFRAMTIKWGTVDYSVFMTRRDYIMLESQGMAFDSDGERVFYHLSHCIDLAECPTLDASHNVLRMRFSMCYISRQLNAETVEMFGRGFVDLRGGLIEHVGVLLVASQITSAPWIVECATMKKMAYLMAWHRRRETSSCDSTTTTTSSPCGVCSKAASKLGSLLASPSGCALCRRIMCSKCSVQKKMTVHNEAQDLTQQSFVVCLICVLQAKNLSAWKVARAARTTTSCERTKLVGA
ncbi:hypothetical protein PsorP6_011109 [Peronosclerospora sorghi]|uniref:Uncharacterized protein n=1 Tax=Peronosclerospora sorghi TaxID=230839 RepID=A0ACC0VYC3_9STRA|nr:hypothetical protein PsorP6_011109 [Peronosclerospora sorghi]